MGIVFFLRNSFSSFGGFLLFVKNCIIFQELKDGNIFDELKIQSCIFLSRRVIVFKNVNVDSKEDTYFLVLNFAMKRLLAAYLHWSVSDLWIRNLICLIILILLRIYYLIFLWLQSNLFVGFTCYWVIMGGNWLVPLVTLLRIWQIHTEHF